MFVHHDEIEPLLQSVIGMQVRLVDYRVVNQHLDYCVLKASLRHPNIEVVVKFGWT